MNTEKKRLVLDLEEARSKHLEEILTSTRENDAEIAKLQDEIANLKAERNKFRQELAGVRAEKVILEGKLDEANCTISDLKYETGTRTRRYSKTQAAGVQLQAETSTGTRPSVVPSQAGSTSNASVGPSITGPSRNSIPTSPVAPPCRTQTPLMTEDPSSAWGRASASPWPGAGLSGLSHAVQIQVDVPPPPQDPSGYGSGSDDEIQYLGMTRKADAAGIPSRELGLKVESPASDSRRFQSLSSSLPLNNPGLLSPRRRYSSDSLSSLTSISDSSSSSEPVQSHVTTPIVPIKVKNKKGSWYLPEQIVSSLLINIPTYVISPDPVVISVPRLFLQETYGGSNRQLFQFINKSKDPGPSTSKHPKGRPMVFPSSELNPVMPSKPGQPGLIFGSRHELLVHPPWTVFHKDLHKKNAVWTYLGEYENSLCGEMTTEQFRKQSPRVKENWGKLIYRRKRCTNYAATRARIALRRAGRPLTKANVDDEIQHIRSKGSVVLPVSVKQIIQAFEDGQEAIGIMRMQCVGYDHNFARDLLEKFKVWIPPQAPEKPEGKGKRKLSANPLSDGNSEAEHERSRSGPSMKSVGKRKARKVTIVNHAMMSCEPEESGTRRMDLDDNSDLDYRDE